MFIIGYICLANICCVNTFKCFCWFNFNVCACSMVYGADKLCPFVFSVISSPKKRRRRVNKSRIVTGRLGYWMRPSTAWVPYNRLAANRLCTTTSWPWGWESAFGQRRPRLERWPALAAEPDSRWTGTAEWEEKSALEVYEFIKIERIFRGVIERKPKTHHRIQATTFPQDTQGVLPQGCKQFGHIGGKV